MNKRAGNKGKSKSLADYAYQHIRADIMQGFLKPGDKLRLENLCERYEIGMSPLREALSRLCGDALVVNESQRGFWVATLSVDELEDIVKLTILLGEEALRRSLENGDDAWEERLTQAFDELKDIEERYDIGNMDPEIWGPANSRFHEALGGANDSPWLTKMLNMLYQQSDRYRMIAQVTTQIDSDTHEEHLAMYEAAMSRNTLKLCRISEQHQMHLVDNVRQILGK